MKIVQLKSKKAFEKFTLTTKQSSVIKGGSFRGGGARPIGRSDRG